MAIGLHTLITENIFKDESCNLWILQQEYVVEVRSLCCYVAVEKDIGWKRRTVSSAGAGYKCTKCNKVVGNVAYGDEIALQIDLEKYQGYDEDFLPALLAYWVTRWTNKDVNVEVDYSV